jgi:RNA polymerase sigma-70 factor, ECF subfamily
VRAAQDGTGRQLDALLRALRPVLFEYFVRRVDRSAADDLAQRTLWIVTRQFRTVAPENASRWLVTVARNVLRDEFRRSSRAAVRHAPEQEAGAVPTTDAPAAQAEYGELAEAIMQAVQTTCTASLRAVVLRVMRGLDISEIASELGVSQSAIRVRLTRARALLRHELRRFWDPDDQLPESLAATPGKAARAIGRRRLSDGVRITNRNS